MQTKIPFIYDREVKKLLTVSEAIELIKKAFIQITNKSVKIPQRIILEMPEVNADSLTMPVYSADEKKYGVKIVSLNRDNPTKNLPFIHALMILIDSEYGKPLAILDAENLTAIRTGAASGLATKLFSNPYASVAAIFGAGVQAKYQLKAICEVRKIKKVYLFEKDQSKAKSFIIATESGMLYGLKKANPEKDFYVPTERLICPTMKLTTLGWVVHSLEAMEHQIKVSGEIREKAYRSLKCMLKVSGEKSGAAISGV